MDPPDGCAATATLSPRYGPALVALPELGRPPALLTMPELEAVAAALPGKKRRLRETFERLAASAPGPLPFSWEDLDAYLSYFQYSVTLHRFRQPQVPLPAPVPVQAAVPIPGPATAEDGVVEKETKRKLASSQAAEASDKAHEEMRRRSFDKGEGAIKKACSLQDVDGNDTSLCPAPPEPRPGQGRGAGEHGHDSAVGSRRQDGHHSAGRPCPTRRPSNPASLVQAGAPNPASQQRRPPPPRPVLAPAVVSAPAIAGGDVEKARKLGVERKVEKISVSVSYTAGDAKVSPSPPADNVGNTFASTKADMQVDRPFCEIKAEEQELPIATCGASRAATNIMSAFLPDSSSLLESLAPKPESSVEAADADMHVVVVTEDRPTTPAGNASPLQVKGQEAYEVSPLPLNSGNGFAEAGLDVGTTMLAEALPNTCVQQNSATVTRPDPKLSPDNSPETPKPLQAKGPNANHELQQQQQHMSEVRSEPISPREKLNKLFLGNHGGRPIGSNLELKAQDAVQRLTKVPEQGKGGPGQYRPAAARDFSALPNDDRNNGNGKGKPRVIESSEKSKNSNKFCKKCGSKGHVAHQCRTAKHLVELYLKHRKEKEANQICYRCGTMGHIAIKCRTPKHLVYLYQNHRKASLPVGAPQY